jgi:hypothetical protein
MADLFNLDAEILLADQENPDHPQDTEQQQEQEEGEEWNNDDQQDAEQVEVLPEDTFTSTAASSTTQPQSSLLPYRVDLEDIASTATTQDLDYTKLYSFWRQETQSPELLPFPTDLVDRIKDGIMIATATDDADPIHTGNQGLDALLTSLVTIDADRVTFLLADLLKRRLQKIEAHPFYMAKQQHCMSPDEVSYIVGQGCTHLRYLFISTHPLLLFYLVPLLRHSNPFGRSIANWSKTICTRPSRSTFPSATIGRTLSPESPTCIIPIALPIASTACYWTTVPATSDHRPLAIALLSATTRSRTRFSRDPCCSFNLSFWSYY